MVFALLPEHTGAEARIFIELGLGSFQVRHYGRYAPAHESHRHLIPKCLFCSEGFRRGAALLFPERGGKNISQVLDQFCCRNQDKMLDASELPRGRRRSF